jgi:hypothetical protein
MEFIKFKQILQAHVLAMLEQQTHLFIAEVDKDRLWETYLRSFPPGTNEIFRERREHDCHCCRQFIRAFGNAIVIKENKVVTIWDFQAGEYQPIVDALSSLVRSAPIRDVFVTKEQGFGTDKNYEQREDGTVHTWEHFRIDLPKRFTVPRSSTSDASLMAAFRDVKNVFKRSLDEISRDAIETVLDLIAQNSLYKGEEWQGPLTKFLALHNEYHSLPAEEMDCFCWNKSVEVGGAIGKIRNHSIGVLLTDIAEGMELDQAVRRYEAIVAPTNYKRPRAVFTKRMVEQAQQTLADMGLLNSLGRRFACIEDITINNILFANRDTLKQMGGNVFAELQREVGINPKQFDRVEEVGIEHFLGHILPRTTHIEAFLENRHAPNLVSVIAPVFGSSPTLFKWGNAFSWAYNGNTTDSMKERVKAAGGNVEGVLRFSIQWNEDGDNLNDFDAHCVEPGGNHIYYPNKGRRHPSTGMLDVDIIHPQKDQVAVENIIWSWLGRMPEGDYDFSVHCYSHRGGVSGFAAEIEYNGQIYAYEYRKELRQDERVRVARVRYRRGQGFQIVESLPSTMASKKIWGFDTNQFHPVSVCMFSPNYWDKQTGIGHRHYFFILKGCRNDTQPNGFFNEFLREDLMPHKRVFEALGSKMRVDPSEDQLSGLGFSSTKRNSLICKLKGHVERTIKIIF